MRRSNTLACVSGSQPAVSEQTDRPPTITSDSGDRGGRRRVSRSLRVRSAGSDTDADVLKLRVLLQSGHALLAAEAAPLVAAER